MCVQLLGKLRVIKCNPFADLLCRLDLVLCVIKKHSDTPKACCRMAKCIIYYKSSVYYQHGSIEHRSYYAVAISL